MKDFIAYTMLLGALGTGGNMPFWATANQFGLMPESNGAVISAYAGQAYHKEDAFQYHWAVSLAGRTDKSSAFQVIPDEIYAGIKWKPLSLDLGIWHRDRDFMAGDARLGSLSTSSGNVIWSGNGRSMPGYSLKLDHWGIPGTKHIVEISGAWGDYKTIDQRYVKGSWMHNLQAYLTLNVWRFSFEAGIEQFAEWAGVHPEKGPMPNGFANYWRMCLGKSPVDTGNKIDRYGTCGDQRGRGKFYLSYRQDGWKVALQHDIPYDDRGFFWAENWQDGVNTVSFSFDDKDKWVTDIAYEFIYTMWQSGPLHDRKATPEEIEKYGQNYPVYEDKFIIGGADNYFNNFEYESGWTAFGRTIGLPLITPKGTRDGSWSRNGITRGVENNRIIAHHLGLSGKLFRKLPYKLMLTYSQNYGRWGHNSNGDIDTLVEWNPPFSQFNAGFNMIVPLLEGRLNIIPAIYFDCGNYVRNSFAATLGVSYSICR
ncbi:MAG: hypothetical protein MJY48_02490 [Bacteroidales bacterium]|nr:hypothetical protein [Bacteroidales bacterium]